jgi:hypothetical protein
VKREREWDQGKRLVKLLFIKTVYNYILFMDTKRIQ